MLSVRPYSQFAAAYDGMVGWGFFRRVRRAFATLAKWYHLRFTTAADIGCGTGLFACYLARCWGARVYAVDRSAEMLSVAQRRGCIPKVTFLRQDFRELCLPERVDLITANFDTLNHLLTPRELVRCAKRVAENLRPGGHFYFDIVTPCQPLGGRRWFRRTLCMPWQQLDQLVHWEPSRRLLRILVLRLQAGCALPIVERHAERAYEPAQVGQALLAAGLLIRGVHEESTLRPASVCAPRLIVLARKPAGTTSC